MELQRLGVDVDHVAVELVAGAVVAGDDAGNGLLVVDLAADADVNVLAGAEPAASWPVVDLDRRWANAEEAARLEDPRELLVRRPAEAAEEDRLQGRALALVAAFVDVEPVVPGRAGLVVGVVDRHDGPHAGEVDVAGPAVPDLPREGAHADPLG